MTSSPLNESLSQSELESANRLLARLVRSGGAIEETLDLLDHLSESGNLAAINGFLADFDENFNAITRPDLMAMIANMMMVMGTLSQLDYQPFFDLAMKAPAAMNDGYPVFQKRSEKLGLREALELFRSPEVAGALEMLVACLHSLKAGQQPGPAS